MSARVRVGISSCLLGQKVRYDGGDKRDQALLEAFGRFVEWVPVCPELELGLGAPREPIHLVRTGARAMRLRGVNSQADHTEAMREYARRRLVELEALDLCGYIFKKDSPSCGLRGVPVYNADGTPVTSARERSGSEGPRHSTKAGMFAAALVRHFPDLPVEDEDGLPDARAREEFLERVLAYARRKRGAKRRAR